MSDPAAAPVPAPGGARPHGANAALVLDDGSVFWGRGAGAVGSAVGEVCFNTAITGYQEILTDPSYAGQIITFTFPHIGNVGTNAEDIETATPAVRGLVLRAAITDPANWRSDGHLDAWLKSFGLVAVTGVDTRRLTRRIRDGGAPNGVIVHARDGDIDVMTHNLNQAWQLFRNDLDTGRHLIVTLRDEGPNTEAIGARVYITAGGKSQMREIQCGSNYLGQNPAQAVG